MMMKTKLAGWLATFALACFTSAGAAPLQAAQDTSPAAEQASAGVECYGWSGEAPCMISVSEHLAEARVLMQASGDFAAAKKLLDEAWLHATKTEGFGGQHDLLVEVAYARAEMFYRQGRIAQALEATQELLLREQDLERFEAQRDSMAPATPALLALAAEASQDPRLKELRQALMAESQTSTSDSL